MQIILKIIAISSNLETKTVPLDNYNSVTYNKYITTIDFKRSGKTFPANTYTIIFTLPLDAAPKTDIDCEVWFRDKRISVHINTNGEVKLNPTIEYGDVWMHTIFTFAK